MLTKKRGNMEDLEDLLYASDANEERRNMEDLEDLLYASDANEEKEKY